MSTLTPRPTRVLVVDDEPKIRDLVRRYLQADGFEVCEAADGTTALALFTDYQPDIIVLDVMMPILNGLEVLRRIRVSSNVPVLLLTAREDEIDKVLGLTAGADDYVTKPFGGRELAARLHAILRRLDPHAPPPAPSDGAAGAMLKFDNITIDIGRRQVTTRAGVPELTAMDFELLLTLARAPGHVLSRRQLLAAVWNDEVHTDERVVDVHIRTLRRALADDATHPAIIDTVRSVGYRFLPRPTRPPQAPQAPPTLHATSPRAFTCRCCSGFVAVAGSARTAGSDEPARRANSWRLLRRLVGVAVIVAMGWLVLVPQLRSAAAATRNLSAVDPVWLGVAVAAEAGALLAYARLSQHTLAPVRIGFAAMLRIDLATLALGNVSPAGSVVGAGLGYRLLTRSGVSPAKAISAKTVQAVGSAVVLNLFLAVALATAVAREGTTALYSTATVIILILLGTVATVAVLLIRHPQRSAEWAAALAAVLPGLRPASGSRLAASLTEALGLLTHDRRFLTTTAGWATANWLLDAAALWCAVTAFGHPLGPVGLGVAYGLANLFAAIPLTPGGLGIIEGVLLPVLTSFHTPHTDAVLGITTWRLLNFWAPIPIGFGALAITRRTPQPPLMRSPARSPAPSRRGRLPPVRPRGQARTRTGSPPNFVDISDGQVRTAVQTWALRGEGTRCSSTPVWATESNGPTCRSGCTTTANIGPAWLNSASRRRTRPCGEHAPAPRPPRVQHPTRGSGVGADVPAST